jgi:hypothetical protein
MPRSRFLLLIILFVFSSCKGQRFYWETKFQVREQNAEAREHMTNNFVLTNNLSTWHPVFGEYCSGLASVQANLFVCWKGDEVRVISSYAGAIKGDDTEILGMRTIEKYLEMITKQEGYQEHKAIAKFIERNYKVKNRVERLLTYGRGSLIIKQELEK